MAIREKTALLNTVLGICSPSMLEHFSRSLFNYYKKVLLSASVPLPPEVWILSWPVLTFTRGIADADAADSNSSIAKRKTVMFFSLLHTSGRSSSSQGLVPRLLVKGEHRSFIVSHGRSDLATAGLEGASFFSLTPLAARQTKYSPLTALHRQTREAFRT